MAFWSMEKWTKESHGLRSFSNGKFLDSLNVKELPSHPSFFSLSPSISFLPLFKTGLDYVTQLVSVSQRSLCLHLTCVVKIFNNLHSCLTLSYVFIIFVLLKINSILTQYLLIIVTPLSTPPNLSQPPLASRFTYFLSLVIKGQGSKIYQRWENRIK